MSASQNLVQESPILQSTTPSPFPIQLVKGKVILTPAQEQMMSRRRARLKSIAKEYGVSENEADRIAYAQDELAKCAKCQGFASCPFEPTSRGFTPVIKVVEGLPEIRYGLCKYAIEVDRKAEAESRLARSGIPERLRCKTFDDYEVTPDNRHAVKLAKELSKGLLLIGKVGTGKSLLAAIVAQGFLAEGKSVIFKDTPELLRELKATFGDVKLNFDSVMKSYCEVDLLILDDLGSEKPTDWAVEQIYSIVNSRYNSGKKLIVTSNYGGEELRQRLNVGGVMGDRIISRLKEMCVGAFLGGKDRRG